MALPDFTTQDSTTYKTNIDATAADHDGRIAANEAGISTNAAGVAENRTGLESKVSEWGMGLDPNDGSLLVGTMADRAIVSSTNTDGSTGYPSNGQVWTFNTVDLGRLWSIHKQNGGGQNLHIQTYAADGTASGWSRLRVGDGVHFGAVTPAFSSPTNGDITLDVATYNTRYLAISFDGDTNILYPVNMEVGEVLRLEMDNAAGFVIKWNGTDILTAADNGFYWFDIYMGAADNFTAGKPQPVA